MLQFLWVILQFILKFLLILLSAVLVLAALFLLVPFVYRIEGKVDSGHLDESAGSARLSWAGVIVCLQASFTEAGLDWSFRLFGLKILSSDREKKRKAESGETAKREGTESGETEEPEDSDAGEAKEAGGSESGETEKRERVESGEAKEPGGSASGNTEGYEKPASGKAKGSARSGKESGFSKLSRFLSAVSGPESRETLGRLWHRICRLLRHIAPRHMEGELYYGMEDPALTGMLLGAASMILPLHRKGFAIHPDFAAEQNHVSGQMKGSGLFFLAVLIWQLLPLVFDRNVRTLFRRLR